MFDFINGVQVKCFYTPCYTSDEDSNGGHIFYSGGSSISYVNGDDIPENTGWFKYPNNFIILNLGDDISGTTIHVIRDRKIQTTLDFKNITDSIFESIDCVYDCKGRIMNISSLSDIYCFFESKKECCNKESKIAKQKDIIYKEILNVSWVVRRVNVSDNKVFVNHISDDDYLEIKKFIYDYEGIKFSSKDELIDYIREINEYNFLIKKIKSIILDRLSRELSFLEILYDEEFNKYEFLLNPILKKFNDTWFKDDIFQCEKKLGGYLECMNYILHHIDNGTIRFGLINFAHDYNCCLNDIRKLLKKNDNLIHRYKEWLDVDFKTKTKIEMIISRIEKEIC